MSKQLIKLGHSPDPDDAFMFYGLAQGQVDSGNFEFEHILRDIQTLNDWARTGKLEVTAISVHAYAYVQGKYTILSSGASMGATDLAAYVADDGSHPQNQSRADVKTTPKKGGMLTRSLSMNNNTPTPARAQGPLVVAREKFSLDELSTKKIAIPGTMTSAFLALQLAIGKFDYTVMMFDEIPAAVQQGTVDAGLIIHEGQLTYAQAGLHCILDLGCWWFERTQLPLPLGCNVIRRDLGPEVMSQVSTILKTSIKHSLANRPEAVKYALQFGRGLDMDLADEFVGMYVNDWTVDYGPKGRQAIHDLLQQGHTAGLTPTVPQLDFV
jgi:1,4-dihydroxy-6-naphthoate synthase